jgi:tetratricopeptide (TPR) repeat protein
VLFGAVVRGADIDRLDDPLEITLRVVDLRTTEQRGALELVGKMRELFALEADLAARAAGLFGIRLSPAEEEALRTQETRSLQAYKESVLGRIYLDDGKFDAAITMFEQALIHHPGIFYPRAHTLLAEAYARSGRKEEMLRRMKKDAASLAGVSYQLGAAQEFNGQPEEAAKSYALFLKYTDRRTLHWKRAIPTELQVRGVDASRVWLAARSGVGDPLVLPLDGADAPRAATGAAPPVTPVAPAIAAAVPEAERRRLSTAVIEAGGRIYYGLANGFLIGREAKGGARVWAYRTAGTPTGTPAYADGTLVAQDDRGFVYRLGLHEGGEPSDVAAYLRLADLARRREQTADAEG